MTRKRAFGYYLFLVAGFLGMLAFVAPPLVAEPLGFAVAFAGVLFVALLLNWAVRNRGGLAKGTVNGFMLMASFLVFGAMGLVGWAMLAVVLMLIMLRLVSPRVKPAQHGRPVPPAHDKEVAARGVVLPWNENRPAKSYSH